MTRNRIPQFALLLAITLLVAYAAWAFGTNGTTTATTAGRYNLPNIPIREGGQELSRTTTEGTYYTAQQISFIISDAPQVVERYYSQLLKGQGWHDGECG